MEWTENSNSASLLQTFHPIREMPSAPATNVPCQEVLSSAEEVASKNVRNYTTMKDILGGKDYASTSHEGNMYYRELIKKNKDEYNSMEDNKQKKDLVRRLYIFLKSNDRRFMKRSDISDVWVEMDEENAMKKIGQALREKRHFRHCSTNSQSSLPVHQNTSKEEAEDDNFCHDP
mmetsp:Transcript_8895/g.11141  ORF Transcript_8895/g.11141 Transcript_8895/m.11141 type:complete len:175 (+) Transcript_8895:3-527(+)